MSLTAPMPSDLRHWVIKRVPGAEVDQAADVSWGRGNSRVWRVPAHEDSVFVKLSPTALDYEREIAGYAYAARVLAPYEAPRLLAADPHLQSIMSSPLPGRVVRGLPLEPDVERHVHELAGRVLRRWHDHSEPASPHAIEAVGVSMAEQAEEAATCLENTATHLDDPQRALVRSVAKELPMLAAELPVVWQHGDYSTRNWLWNPEPNHGHGHGLIDFAMAKHGPAVEEFVWLCGAVWVVRPDLETAYLTGYGRSLSDTETRLLRLLTTRLGVSYLNSGLTKQRRDLVDRGKLVLNRMRDYQ